VLELVLNEVARTEGCRKAFVVNVAYYQGQDLQGDNDGTTLGSRAASVPVAGCRKASHASAQYPPHSDSQELAPPEVRCGREEYRHVVCRSIARNARFIAS
jgi:hypothetical protein